jgi:hypothetical protein
MTEGGKEAIRVDEEVVGSSEVKALEKPIRELERVLGKKTMENEILREAVKVAHEKTHLALAVIARRGFKVRSVADKLGVSRSQLHSRLREGSRLRRGYQKSEDAKVLAAIRTLPDNRPTYGYRRICLLLNRQRQSAAIARVDHKRIYRLLSPNGLWLQRSPASCQDAPTKVRSSRSARILGGRRTASRSLTGTAKPFASPSLSTPAMVRSCRGSPPPAGSLGK